MIIDNFNLISEFVSFNNENEFYFLQIIQRKKDNNKELHVDQNYRVIKSFYLYSKEELLNLKDRIIELCTANNARAYINLNVRNTREIALHCIEFFAKVLRENDKFIGHTIWDKMCGTYKATGNKALWIVDLDTKDLEIVRDYMDVINTCRGNDNNHIKLTIPTANGYHLITSGFDLTQFRLALEEYNLTQVDIHKNNPTLLYFNDLSSQ